MRGFDGAQDGEDCIVHDAAGIIEEEDGGDGFGEDSFGSVGGFQGFSSGAARKQQGDRAKCVDEYGNPTVVGVKDDKFSRMDMLDDPFVVRLRRQGSCGTSSQN